MIVVFKSLRIIASTFFLILSAMFTGLFVRSSHTRDTVDVTRPSMTATVTVLTVPGAVVVCTRTVGPWEVLRTRTKMSSRRRTIATNHEYKPIPGTRWFRLQYHNGHVNRWIPLWTLATMPLALTLLIRWNLTFSLKQMFFIVTLFAVCLGLGAIH